jgi:hypothetical protein
MAQTFDLKSWKGLTHVLKAGKESLKDPHAYAEFRDVVLQYAQRGGDAELRKKIDAVIASFSSAEPSNSAGTTHEPAAKKQEQETEKGEEVSKGEPRKEKPNREKPNPSAFGMRRRQPLFTANSVAFSKTQTDPVQPGNTGVSGSMMPHQEEVTKTSRPVFRTVEEHKARIAEIKRLVHARVGNPAALVGTNNAEGRAYIATLLGALKATGGNGTENVDNAMAKLESAYETLITFEQGSVIANDDARTGNNESESKAEKEEMTAVSGDHEVPSSEEKREFPHIQPTPKQIFEKSDTDISSVLENTEKKKYSASNTLTSLLAKEEEKSREHPGAIRETSSGRIAVPEPVSKEVETPTQRTAVAEATFDTRPFVAAVQSELSAPQITEALHQLLHEWSVFSGSGFLGMGAGGSEHPLYQKLAPLSMGEVLAGRYEGVNPKNTKVIKQYIDAWRHEQGIAYTVNETFEHYLRRVVQRILKRQEL